MRLLQVESQHVGAPLIRGYCNLALFRANEKGPWSDNLHTWLREQWQRELIRLQPVVPWAERGEHGQSAFALTPQEGSQLLIESIEALAQRQDEEAVDILLEALAKGNPRNRYPIAGLLIRITQ